MAGRVGDDRRLLPTICHSPSGAVGPRRPGAARRCVCGVGPRPLRHGGGVQRARSRQAATAAADPNPFPGPSGLASAGRVRGRACRPRAYFRRGLWHWSCDYIPDDGWHLGRHRPPAEHRSARLHGPGGVLAPQHPRGAPGGRQGGGVRYSSLPPGPGRLIAELAA